MENETAEKVQKLVNDPMYRSFLILVLKEIHFKRSKRPEPPPGRVYKKDWYDEMTKKGLLNANYFLDHMQDFYNKKSKHSSRIRAVMSYIYDLAYMKTLEDYKELSEGK